MRNINIPSVSTVRDSTSTLNELISQFENPQGLTIQVQQCLQEIDFFTQSVECALYDIQSNFQELEVEMKVLKNALDKYRRRDGYNSPPPEKTPLSQMPFFNKD